MTQFLMQRGWNICLGEHGRIIISSPIVKDLKHIVHVASSVAFIISTVAETGFGSSAFFCDAQQQA